MLGIFRNEVTTRTDSLIDAVLEKMHEVGVDSEEYPKLLAHLKGLNEIKAAERPPRISPDTMALIAGNLTGILLIIAYEQKHVMTSKALAQINRLR